jgi:hypothetical protein
MSRLRHCPIHAVSTMRRMVANLITLAHEDKLKLIDQQ